MLFRLGLLFINIAHNIFEDRWGCGILEINGEADHLHILFEAPPQVALSKLVNNFKTVSSRLIRKTYEEELQKFYWKPYFWQNSYLALSAGGVTIEVIKKYIEGQNAPERV